MKTSAKTTGYRATTAIILFAVPRWDRLCAAAISARMGGRRLWARHVAGRTLRESLRKIEALPRCYDELIDVLRAVIFLFTLIGAEALGCAQVHDERPGAAQPSGSAESAPERESYGPGHLGPACGADGPRVRVVRVAWSTFGKPPRPDAFVDFVVHNPLADPVWLLLEYSEEPRSDALSSAEVLQPSSGAPAFLWTFQGRWRASAIQVAARMQVAFHGLRIRADRTHDRLEFAFAAALGVDGVPADRWLGVDGMTTGSDPKGGPIEFERALDERRVAASRVEPSGASFRLSVARVCSQVIELGTSGGG